MDNLAGSARKPLRAELAHRSHGGLDVTLLWVPATTEDDEEELVVCVLDRHDGAYFEVRARPDLALDVYGHPYAYRELSVVNHEERPTARTRLTSRAARVFSSRQRTPTKRPPTLLSPRMGRSR